MKLSLKSFFALLYSMNLVFALSSSLAQAHRISGPSDPNKRCMMEGLPADKCEVVRQRALAIGCITQEEYEALRNFGSAPSCNVLIPSDNPAEMLDGWCSCGCFHPDTLISILSAPSTLTMPMTESLTAGEVANRYPQLSLVHMDANSNLNMISLSASPIRNATRGLEKHPLIELSTTNNKTLRLTEKHPVLLASGKMVQAKEVRLGDQLVSDSDQMVFVNGVKENLFEGEVVNFATDANSELEHVIFAEGLAVGDLFWQASLEDRMNQIILRQ